MNDWQDAEQRGEKAQELFRQRKWQEAMDELRAAISINPYNSAWHFDLGLTLDELGRYGEALESYERALKIDGEAVDALHRVAVDLGRLGRAEEALAVFARLEGVDPTYEPAYCDRIRIHCELGDHEKAEEMFYIARQYKEECPRCFFNIADSLSRRRRFEKAIYCWQKTLDLDESYPSVHLRIAEALWEKGEVEKARQHYIQELRIDPGNTAALLDLGDLLLEMGRVDDAGEKFRRAIELSPDDAQTHLRYGRWHLACERIELARESFMRAISLHRRCPGARVYLAEACLSEGDLDGARGFLRAELQLDPHDPDVLMDLANLLMDCGRSGRAAACLRRLTGQCPDNAAAWQNLAVAQFLAGQYAEGIQSCHAALRCDAGLTSTMYNLALAFERLGNYSEALLWVKRALEVDPRDGSVQRLELRIRVLRGCDWILRRFKPTFFFKHALKSVKLLFAR